MLRRWSARRDVFLAEMAAVVPWTALDPLIVSRMGTIRGVAAAASVCIGEKHIPNQQHPRGTIRRESTHESHAAADDLGCCGPVEKRVSFSH
jgi:hypothetical protein